MAKEIPPQFLGRFKLVDSENFDKYLEAKGLPWPVRKLLEKCSFTKVIEPAGEAGRYNLHAIIPVKTTVFKKWALDEWFDATGFDGKKRQMMFRLVDGPEGPVLEEHYNDAGELEVIRHYAPEEGKLLIVHENKGVKSRSNFVRQQH